jgi:uncharacterized protein YdhG (YjbR/CyaY superfamily)/predicted DNA-binding protein (MmcQ/YjbR family)
VPPDSRMQMTGNSVYYSIDDYIRGQPAIAARELRRLRRVVRKLVPAAKESISYGIPAFSLDKVFLYLAGFKAHIGVFPPVRNDARLRQALVAYSNKKGNLRFMLSQPMPLKLISRVIVALAKEHGHVNKADKGARRSRASAPEPSVRIRGLCLAFPGVHETNAWGHPNFLVGKTAFVTLESIKGRPSVAIRLVADQVDELCMNSAFFPTPYGKGRWVSTFTDGRLNWRQLRLLIVQSHRLVAPSQLEARRVPPRRGVRKRFQ